MLRTPFTLARLLLIVLLAANIYRAATQSITVDEAYTYHHWVSAPIPESWKIFDANDHVLHTLLCKLSVGLFGVSGFTLRIPALLGGLLYLWIALRLCMMLFGAGWFSLAAFALMTLNPFILDYCSMARGYGMATALLLTSLHQMLQCLDQPDKPRGLEIAGVTLALAAVANLTCVVPGVLLAALFSALYLSRRPLVPLIERFAVPAIVIGAFLLIRVAPATRGSFYVGEAAIAGSARSFFFASLWRPDNPLKNLPGAAYIESNLTTLALLLPAAILLLAWIRLLRSRSPQLLLMTCLCTGILFSWVALHDGLGVPYPYRRTGLYWVPLLTLLAAITFHQWRPVATAAGCIVALLCLISFAAQWNVRYYDDWAFDAGTKDIMRYLRSHAPPGGRSLTTGTSLPITDTIEFYRNLYRMEWLVTPDNNKGTGGSYDVYLLRDSDLAAVQQHGLTVRMRHRVSKVTLATAPSSGVLP